MLTVNTAPTTGVTRSEETITGSDGNDITLYIHRPDETDGPLPCVVHTHDGGMAILSATGQSYVKWRDDLAATGRTYDPDGTNATNPLAWPMHASTDDLVGLPPHVISVNQLDPLRDEGFVYYRKLLDAGVSTVGRTVNGTCHAGDCLFLDAMPDVWHATIRDIKGFADSL